MSSRLAAFGIAFLVFALDWITKLMIRAHVGPFDTYRVIPGLFNIVHAENPGVAFGLLAESTGIWRAIFLIGLSATVMVFIGVTLWKPSTGPAEPILRTGLSLILGGAFGNLFDRLLVGTVTDFIEVYWGPHVFPAFNVADSAITVGACLLFLDMWIGRNRKANLPKCSPS